MSQPVVNIQELTPQERLRLIGELWDSLGDDPSSVPVTAAQKAELDRRIEAMEQGQGENLPLETVLEDIQARRREKNRH